MERCFLNGSNGYIVTDSNNNPIKLFDADSPSFTLAINFQYTPDGNNYAPAAGDTLLSCFTNLNNGDDGFRMYINSNNSPYIHWGDKTQKAAQTQMCGMVVPRHQAGSKDLVVYSFNASTSTDNYYGNTATKATLSRANDTETDEQMLLLYLVDMLLKMVVYMKYHRKIKVPVLFTGVRFGMTI